MLLHTLLAAALIVLTFIVLIVALARISGQLRAIGGTPTSLLAKLRLGLRAIERETAALAPNATKLNRKLSELTAGLRAVATHLAGTVSGLREQARRPWT